MNRILILAVLILITVSKLSFSYDSTLFRYMPLQVGNSWVYQSYNYNVLRNCDAYEKYTVVGTEVYGGHLFYIVQRRLSEFSGNSTNCGSFFAGSRLYATGNIRIDSLTYNIYGDNSMCIIDSLGAKPLDSNNVCYSHFNLVHCDTGRINLFGMNRKSMSFGGGSFESGEGLTYVMDIGMVGYSFFQPGPNPTAMSLRGCVISGMLYGDTGSLASIHNTSQTIPSLFALSQNYPNPFNPKTVIRFQVASDKFVSLKIFDALGREVETLVSQQLKPGTYEADWDGTNYPSGVYFYQLSIGDDQLATKKMVLIK